MQDKKCLVSLGGLGNQYPNMAKVLFQNNQSFQRHLESFEATVSQEVHFSVIDYLFKPETSQKETLKDCLGLFAIEYAAVNYLIGLGFRPDYYLGQSMGELVAAVLSEAIDLKDMLHLLVGLTDALNKPQKASGMLSVCGSWESVEAELEEMRLCEYAGKNHSAHFLIAYEEKRLASIKGFFRERDMLTIPLDIPYGFHSSYIDFARDEFFLSGEKVLFYQGKTKCFSAIDGREIEEFGMKSIWDAIRMPYDIPGTLARLTVTLGDFIVVDLTPNGAIYSYIKHIDRKLGACTLLKGMDPSYDGTRQIRKLLNIGGGNWNG